MSPIPRRSLLKAAAVAGAAAQFSWALGAGDAQAAPADADPVILDWLEDGGLGAAPAPPSVCPGPRAPTRRTAASRSPTPTAEGCPCSRGPSRTGPTAR